MKPDIDPNTMNGIRKMMGARFHDLAGKYLKSASAYIEEAKRAAKNRDAHGVVEAVHPLKSSSASMGLVRMAALAQNVEKMAMGENPDWVAITGGIDALNEAFLPVSGILNLPASGE